MIANFILNQIGVTCSYTKEVEALLVAAIKESNKPRGCHLFHENQLKLFELPNCEMLIKTYLETFPADFSSVFCPKAVKKLFELNDATELWNLFIIKSNSTCFNYELEKLLVDNPKLTEALKTYIKKECPPLFKDNEETLFSRPDANEIVPFYISVLKDKCNEEAVNQIADRAKEHGVPI